MYFSTKHFQPAKKTALIVGASQGLGVEFAKRLHAADCLVILVARRENIISELAAQLNAAELPHGHTAAASHVACDVSEYDHCVALWKTILVDRNQDPDFIFCCVGSSIPKLFTDLTASDLKSGFNTNYVTALNISHTGFKKIHDLADGRPNDSYKKRHLIFFSSVAAFYPFIGYAQYSPSKAAVSTLSCLLRQELGPYNFRVTCVFPGSFASEGYEEEEKTKPSITKEIEGASKPIPVDECADLIISQMSKGYDTITTDFIGWLLGCSVLGVLPRNWGFFQIIVGLLFLIIEPIASWVVLGDVRKFYKKMYSEGNRVGGELAHHEDVTVSMENESHNSK